MRVKLLLGAALVLTLLATGSGFTLAQEATPEATVEPFNRIAGPWELSTSLEDVTADSEAFYGQTITLEGVIETIINVKMLVLGEGAVIDNDQVLVVNTSGQDFDLSVTEGQRVQITGVVHPSWAEMNDRVDVNAEATAAAGAIGVEATAEATVEAEIPAAEPTAEATAAGLAGQPLDLAELLAQTTLAGYENHTILELTSTNNIVFVGNLDDVTRTPESYAGREMLLQGVVEELNTGGTFVLSEGALVDNARVLIVFNPAELDANITDGQRVQVFGVLRQQGDADFENDLGTVYPDFDRSLLDNYADLPVMVARFVMPLADTNR
ncbi:MAG: hypothetical protein HZC41_11145 [Chloroflexi bacterium]|nr:hypothetical protein [Chloroflexota bacterium]